jgi:hypothetical protein
VDQNDPHAFITLGSVGDFVRELRGPDAPPETIQRYGALAFHGVHFVRAGSCVHLLSTPVVRRLVAVAPDAEARPPGPAGYVQFPQHLLWTEDGHGEAPESVDGLFWTLDGADKLYLLLATGIRADRPGLGVTLLPEAPLGHVQSWVDAAGREGGEDFASTLPGGEIDQLYSLHTAGEVLKLLARFFAFVANTPSSVSRHDPLRGGGSPAPSALPYLRVTLDG